MIEQNDIAVATAPTSVIIHDHFVREDYNNDEGNKEFGKRWFVGRIEVIFVLVVVLGLVVLLPIFMVVSKAATRGSRNQQNESLTLAPAKVYFESSSVELNGRVVAHYMLVDWQPKASSSNAAAARFLLFDDVPDPRNYFLHSKTSTSFQGERGEGSAYSGNFPLYENVTEYNNPMEENIALYRMYWSTMDGLEITLSIDDSYYDLMKGGIFLVTTHFGKPAQIQQLPIDLSSMPSYDVMYCEKLSTDDDDIITVYGTAEPCIPAQTSVQWFVDETPEIIEFLQQVASYNI